MPEMTRLAELADKQAITEILYLYARGWDRMDEEAIRACFHPDSTHKHGGFEGASSDFIRFGLDACKEVRGMSHLITNPLIVLKGDRAISECSFLAHHRRPRTDGGEGEEDFFLKGRYLDRFERRDGVWKIARREGYHDFERVELPADRSLRTAPADQLGRYKPDDALYRMLAEF
jgi:hypothetical protein